MNNPLVSIAMCTYNGEQFIQEQLDSILNQTHQNIELIITDDSSTDKTIDIIQRYQEQDSRIKLYQNKKNLGFIKNFEKAISLCHGEYIALADQDDIWEREKIEIFIREIGDHLLIYSNAFLIDENSQNLQKYLIDGKKSLIKGKCNKAFLFDNCVSGNTLMFKRTILTHILPIPKVMVYHDIWIAFVASTLGTINYTNEILTHYRRHSHQVTKDTTNQYTSFMMRFKEKENVYIENNRAMLNKLTFLEDLHFLDNEIKAFIALLKHHALTFNKGLFNYTLYHYLQHHQHEVFAIKKQHKRQRHLLKTSMKLKLHKLLGFSF